MAHDATIPTPPVLLEHGNGLPAGAGGGGGGGPAIQIAPPQQGQLWPRGDKT